MNVNDITITSLELISGFQLGTGNHLFTMDELQNTTIANSEEKVDVTGKQGRKLNTLKRNKTVTVSGANGLLSGGVLEMQTGGKFENKTTEVMWTDYLTVDTDHKAKTNYKAVGTSGNEIENVYIKNTDGTVDTKLEQAASAAAGKFAYDPSTKELTFHTDVAAGTEIVVYYVRKIQGAVLANESDKFSGKCELYIDALGEDKCANVYHIQFHIPMADFSGEYSIEMGDNPTVHNFEAEGLAGACGAGGTLWTYTVFGANAEDAQ